LGTRSFLLRRTLLITDAVFFYCKGQAGVFKRLAIRNRPATTSLLMAQGGVNLALWIFFPKLENYLRSQLFEGKYKLMIRRFCLSIDHRPGPAFVKGVYVYA
jgi:hypothetical protein